MLVKNILEHHVGLLCFPKSQIPNFSLETLSFVLHKQIQFQVPIQVDGQIFISV